VCDCVQLNGKKRVRRGWLCFLGYAATKQNSREKYREGREKKKEDGRLNTFRSSFDTQR
jgi:hypothetical protein